MRNRWSLAVAVAGAVLALIILTALSAPPSGNAQLMPSFTPTFQYHIYGPKVMNDAVVATPRLLGSTPVP